MSEDDERRIWFRRAVLPLEPLLRANAARFCRGGAEDVDDLVHETFAKLIAFTGWRAIESVPAFALATMSNIALQALRRRKIVPIDLVADIERFDFADEMPSALRTMEARGELRMLARLISELPPQCRRVFALCKIYELSHREIADRLGLSIFTVEKHVTKGLRICSERLASEPGRRARPAVSGKRARGCAENG